MFSGYCEIFKHSKGTYHKYFLRLKTNGSLDWFKDHLEGEFASNNAVDCIQVRGTTSKIDPSAPQIVVMRVASMDYKLVCFVLKIYVCFICLLYF